MVKTVVNSVQKTVKRVLPVTTLLVNVTEGATLDGKELCVTKVNCWFGIDCFNSFFFDIYT